MGTKEIILSYLGAGPARRLEPINEDQFAHFSEIRIRADKPLILYGRGREYAVANNGGLSEAVNENTYRPSLADIGETLERISRYSLYAFEEELRMGYITLPGGHRVGVTGRAVLERQSVRTLRDIGGLNIRIAHQVKGCANGLLPLLWEKTGRLCHTVIVSPPGCGKTTLLRDIVRQVSDGAPGIRNGLTVAVVDERSEIAGCYRGVAQNDVGCRTDVLDACPKAEGMAMLLRAMRPDVIAVDELGGERDARAVEDVLNAGVKLLCTAHGQNREDLRRKPAFKTLMDKPVFERYIVLYEPGRATVYNGEGEVQRDVS